MVDPLFLAAGRPAGDWATCPGAVPRAFPLACHLSARTVTAPGRKWPSLCAPSTHAAWQTLASWGPLLLWAVSLGTLGTHYLVGVDMTPKLLPDTEQVPAPLRFLTLGTVLSRCGPPQREVWKTVPFVPGDHAVPLAPGLDPEARPGQALVLGAGVRMSCDQGVPGALAELPGESLPLGPLRGGWGGLVLPVSKPAGRPRGAP